MKRFLGAYAVALGVFYVGVTYFFDPAMARDLPGDPILPSPGGLLVAVALQVAFYDWVAQHMQDSMKAALALAVPQILLVDVLYVLNGTRRVDAGIISAIIIFVGWMAVAKVYAMLSDSMPSPDSDSMPSPDSDSVPSSESVVHELPEDPPVWRNEGIKDQDSLS